MKFVYVCRGCGSADITEKCGKLINEGEIIASCILTVMNSMIKGESYDGFCCSYNRQHVIRRCCREL